MLHERFVKEFVIRQTDSCAQAGVPQTVREPVLKKKSLKQKNNVGESDIRYSSTKLETIKPYSSQCSSVSSTQIPSLLLIWISENSISVYIPDMKTTYRLFIFPLRFSKTIFYKVYQKLDGHLDYRSKANAE